MDLHHTGCEEKVLLSIENERLSIYIKGKVPHNRWIVGDTKVYDACYRIMAAEEVSIALDGGEMGEEHLVTIDYMPLFFEQQNYQVVIESMTDEEIAFDHNYKGIRESVKYLGRKKEYFKRYYQL